MTATSRQTMAELREFADGFNMWRRVIARGADPAARFTMFENAATEIAGYVSKGLDRALAADELREIAEANALIDDLGEDSIQNSISRAFEKIERTPDPLEMPGKINGANGKAAIDTLGEWDAGDDPGEIKPREWLLANQFCCQYISSIVAAGGTGKSALRLLQFVSLALGPNHPAVQRLGRQSLCGQWVFKRSRVLLISLEDDTMELQRRITALLQYYEISRSELKGWLFCAAPRQMLKLAELKQRARIKGLLEAQIRGAIERIKPKLVSLDPFVKTHALEENSSGDMDFVCDLLACLGVEYNIAVDSPHHVHKGTIEPGNADAGRGSSGIRDAARLINTLCQMSEEEAGRMLEKNEQDQRRFYVRLDPAKINIAAPSLKATWFKLVGVNIGNTTDDYPNGDTIQVAEPWTPPSAWDVPVEVLNQILNEIAKGTDTGRRYSNAPRATADRQAWMVVQRFCPDKPEGQCRTIISAWLDSKLLYPDVYKDPVERRDQRGLYVDDSKRPQ